MLVSEDNDNYNQLKCTASSLIIHACVSLKFFTYSLLACSQLIAANIITYIQHTGYFIVLCDQYQFQRGVGTNDDPSVWEKFLEHILLETGPYMTAGP